MTADISRHSIRPLQNYSGVVRQQGRLPLDAEETEAGDIGSLMLRDAIAETICEKGAPGDGFLVSGTTLSANNLLDFTLADGSFYLAGLRFTTAQIPGSGATSMTYQDQPDWIGMDVDAAGPSLPDAGDLRTDLVYLEASEQTVTASEDSELFEVALGGADSAARRRVMSRVKVLEDTSDTCHEAFAELVARKYPGGVLDAAGCEVKSQTELTVGFATLDPLNDLCRPSAQAGFLGARNETFRVQVSSPGRFVWGRDNAAPLFRVQVQAHPTDNTRRKIVFLTPPRDEFGWPLAGMTVEVLRWGALLDNREKVAESQGLLLSVDNGYDPDDDSILVSAEVPQAWDDWFTSADGLAAINPLDDSLAGLETYFYLRVWSGGGDAGAVDHAIDTLNPVDLGETGLTALFSSDGMPGDYWIISARPNTPTRVTPHALLTGSAPIGPRRLLAPLALIPWTGPVPGDALDCRHRFRPLCRVGGCCRVTVGDGLVSHGDVSSIQEAINRLPPEGGEVCIHEGDFVEDVNIDNKINITITGCGRGTRWAPNTANNPTLSLNNCTGIHVRRLTLMAGTQQAVLSKTSSGSQSAALLLEDLRITASDASAITVIDIESATVRRCQVDLQPMSVALSQDPNAGRTSAIFLAGTDLVVEDCRIDGSQVEDRLSLAVGGIHIAAGSERIIIRDNVITGGNGHGITLGSVQFVAETGELSFESITRLTNNAGGEAAGYYSNHTMSSVGSYRTNLNIDASGCINLPGTPGEIDIPEDTPVFPESGGVVRDLRILRNDITGMGFNGISAHVFSGLGKGGFADMVAIETIDISDNRITGCMINEVGATTPLLRQFIGWGGIALSLCSDATIRDNLIADNGASSTDPVCGVFLAIAEDVRIERNRIEGNGIDPNSNTALAPGRRGGIIVGFAIGGVSTYGDSSDKLRSVDRPALMVSGNTIDAPGARALKAITMGPVIVLGNRLTGAGRSALASNVFGSLVVAGLALSRLNGQIFNPAQTIDLLDYVFLELLSEVLGGDAVNLISLCVAEELAFAISGNQNYQPERLRGGEMLVNNNQISLQPHSQQLPYTLSSVMLMSADDVSFCDNQSEIENSMVLALTNVLAVSVTLRISSNRLQKRLTAGILSAVTFGLLNQTANNQTTHCILAFGPPAGRQISGNRDMLGLLGIGFCEAFENLALQLSGSLGQRYGSKANTGGQ